MKCPFCKEEIERNTDVCPICGENIPKIFQCIDYAKNILQCSKAKKIYKVGIIALISLFLINSLIGFTMSILSANTLTDKGYKSISTEIQSDCSLIDMVNSISTQEKDLMYFFKKSKNKEDNAKLFKIFLDNMFVYQDKFNNMKNTMNDFERYGIEVFQEPNPSTYFYNEVIKIKNPEINVFIAFYNGQGIGFNYKYMHEKYSSYLTDDFKDYLKILFEEKKKLYIAEGDDIDKTFHNVANEWTLFLEKYPNFCLKEKVKKDIKEYSDFGKETAYD